MKKRKKIGNPVWNLATDWNRHVPPPPPQRICRWPMNKGKSALLY